MSEEIELKWEWPAYRTPAEFIELEVIEFGKVKGGIFGTNKSPSLAENLPNPIVIIGKIVSS